LVALSLAVAGPASAAPGDLDTTFSGDGKVTTNFTPKAEWAIDLAIQADGKIVAAGVAGFGGSNAKFALARYNTNGSLDAKFSGDGKVTTDFTPKLDAANSVAIQPGGKIVAAGVAGFGGSNAKFALARYNTNGSLDATFGGDGKVTTDLTPKRDSGRDLAIKADGKIVAAGAAGMDGSNPKFALARYNTNGSLDATFSGDGKVFTDFTNGDDESYGVALQGVGKIVAAGEAGAGGSNSKFALSGTTPTAPWTPRSAGTARSPRTSPPAPTEPTGWSSKPIRGSLLPEVRTTRGRTATSLWPGTTPTVPRTRRSAVMAS